VLAVCSLLERVVFAGLTLLDLEALLALLALETIALLPSQFVSLALLAMGGTHKLLFDFSSMRTCSSSLSCDNGKLVLCLWRLCSLSSLLWGVDALSSTWSTPVGIFSFPSFVCCPRPLSVSCDCLRLFLCLLLLSRLRPLIICASVSA
jgi:hypothetical protein